MPDESDFRNYKTIEEFGKTVEGTRYLHSLYLKAVNHPIRREILNVVNEVKKISRDELLTKLLELEIIPNEGVFDYNMDYLIKALCIEKTEENDLIFYLITQGGKVVDYLK